NETLWLIQILPNNRATIYEGKSEVGGLTRMLNILEKYVHSMEPWPRETSDSVMEIHLFSEQGTKVLHVGAFWLRDGERFSEIERADYDEMYRLGEFRDEDAARALNWIQRRNEYYVKKNKSFID